MSTSANAQMKTLEKKSFELIQYEQIDLLELELLKDAIVNSQVDRSRVVEAIDRLIKNNMGETSLIREIRSDLNTIIFK